MNLQDLIALGIAMAAAAWLTRRYLAKRTKGCQNGTCSSCETGEKAALPGGS